MKILFAASECAPFFKTGGLGDVAGALPKELAKKKETDQIAVILPYFKDEMKEVYKKELKDEFWDFVNVGWRREYVGVKSLVRDGVKYYFLDNEHYFAGKGLYGYNNDGERFAFFDLAICQLLEKLDDIPDIIHVNDWQTAMVPFLLKEKFNWINAYKDIKTVLTIHNMQFQGWLQGNALIDLFGMGMERFNEGVVRHDNMLNMLKAGLLYADKVNTVSPSYAEEIKTAEFGCGLEPILNFISGKLSGILNGIDYDVFNPETDPLIAHHFSKKDLSGKAKMKADLQEKLGLPVKADKPLIGMVSRLTDQKGFDLVLSELDHILKEDVQIVLLGTGFPYIEDGFKYFAAHYPDKISTNIAFNLQFAQEIYAASDLFLMPSAFEPCGLSQMISMRYGTLPIVHEIGGLKDTVIPYNPSTKTGTGFGFVQFDGYTLTKTVQKAVQLYQENKADFDQVVLSAMTEDFSWESKAQLYIELYQAALK
ncbi:MULTISPECIES: glycogen synthase GlgA [unclassified Lactococcus]|uniref:glycogen synthase GlgA n=1 Tax=unclassified Lactococcus TaxID=2643510 RepID=UPI0011CA07BA|nr:MULTISPECIES: glycogen synthase GlgA [unclassified Lactococcus]MQW22446.1 glycogen synthase GlgA [Lactococcus sp. dk101]TXK45475.1 glycogen synthase GlgA [Lactococcus sp. dk310]TXK51808.1 glycogen synthase GlgA [Lactococcus sp. dk322]